MTNGRTARWTRMAAVAAAMTITAGAPASLVLGEIGTAVEVGFDGFQGLGFHHDPGAGQLDSDTWRVTGLSDGDGIFGGVHDGGDFARGRHPGGTSTGGVYAFEVAPGDFALGVQAGSNDFTPGAITLSVRNETGETLTAVALTWDLYIRNDADRSSVYSFTWSLDDRTWTGHPETDIVSPEASDPMPAWEVTDGFSLIRGLSLAPGASMLLRWSADDFAGTGARDEFALDNFSVTAIPAPGPLLLLGIAGLVGRRRR